MAARPCKPRTTPRGCHPVEITPLISVYRYRHRASFAGWRRKLPGRQPFWAPGVSRYWPQASAVFGPVRLDFGERALADEQHVGRCHDQVVAVVEHLLRGAARERDAAELAAGRLGGRLGTRDQRHHLRILDVAELADAAGEIVRPDEQHVDAVDRGDLL